MSTNVGEPNNGSNEEQVVPTASARSRTLRRIVKNTLDQSGVEPSDGITAEQILGEFVRELTDAGPESLNSGGNLGYKGSAEETTTSPFHIDSTITEPLNMDQNNEANQKPSLMAAIKETVANRKFTLGAVMGAVMFAGTQAGLQAYKNRKSEDSATGGSTNS